MAPKTKGQQQEAETGARDGGHEVDTDAEHDPDRSRRASNAGLRGEVRVAEVDKKKRTHDVSSGSTLEAAAASLRLVAKHMAEGRETVDQITKGSGSSEAADGPTRDGIQDEFSHVYSEILIARRVISSLERISKQQLAPEVKQVKSAYPKWQPYMQGASTSFKVNLNLTDLTAQVNTLDQAIGFDDALQGEAKPLEGSEDSLVKSSVKEHLEAALAAGKSAAEGNSSDAKRVALHVTALASIAKQHPGALKKKEIDKVVSVAKAAQKDAPGEAGEIEAAVKMLTAKH
jgi:hypothetical protein